ncbi:MAG: hypothetical protein ACR2F6_02605 [Mycobacteriales bacterium]
MEAGSNYIIVSLYSTFTVQSQASTNSGSKIVKIQGHPAAITGGGAMIVALGNSASAPGVVKFYTSDPQEQAIGRKLLPKFLANCKLSAGDIACS